MKVIFVDATSSEHMRSEDLTAYLSQEILPRVGEHIEFPQRCLLPKILARMVDDYVKTNLDEPEENYFGKVLEATVLKVTHVMEVGGVGYIRLDLDYKFNYK
jgi:hypothetical protein